MNARAVQHLFLISLVVFIPQTVWAQRSMPEAAVRQLESSLERIGMRTSDLGMPPDLLDRDRRRTPFHDSLFTDPLHAVDRLDELRMLLAEQNPATMYRTYQQMLLDVGLGSFIPADYTSTLKVDYVTEKLGSDPTSRVNFITSILLLRYVSAIITASDDMARARSIIRTRYPQANRLDSLWRMSREDETSTLWQMAEAERIQQRVAREIYDGVPSDVAQDIVGSGLSLYQQLLLYTLQSDLTRDILVDSVQSATFDSPIGRIAIGGPGNDLYVGSYAIIIDVGGNDVYNLSTQRSNRSSSLHVQCIIDLDGHDTYRAGDHALGSGFAGAGILIDRRGNDVYVAGDYSLGSGLVGVGIVHDLEGDDTYTSGTNTQGSGIYGIGILYDDNGHDTYRCHAQGQGFGGTAGVGILNDLRGNDQYIAASPYVDILRYDSHQVTFAQGAALGSRPYASGGIGILLEHDGNDQYVCDIYGQGTGYWFGLGGLVDVRGDDRYQAYQYAQGSGVHFATGVLRDHSGSDVYVSHGVSMGCGHDVATGVLLDEAGDDAYVVESLSLGGGNANAVSIFIDLLGNDAYIAQHEPSTMGYSDFRRSYGMIGVFVDADGTDSYTSKQRNNTWSMKSTYGVFVDTTSSSLADQQQAMSQASTLSQAPLATSLDSLFIQASAAPLRFQPNVAPARSAIASKGEGALPFLAERMSTQMPRERITLETVLPQIYATAPTSTSALLRSSLRSMDAAASGVAATIISKVRDTSCITDLIALASDPSWRRRRLAVFTWGDLNDTLYSSSFEHLLRDPVPYVRQRAAYAFAKQPSSSFDQLRSVLTDEDHVVRSAAVEGALRGRRRSMRELQSWCVSITDPLILRTNMRLLACSDTTEADVREFALWYHKTPALTREMMDHLLPTLPSPWNALTAEQLTSIAFPPKKRKQRRTSQ